MSPIERMEAGTWIGEVMRRMIAHQEDLASEARERALRAILHLERDIVPPDSFEEPDEPAV